jgi:hypothetical protein
VDGGNRTSLGAPAGTFGTIGTPVTINGNLIHGESAAKPMEGDCIAVALAGRGTGVVSITNNGTAGTPLAFVSFVCIEVASYGATDLTATVTGNRVSPQVAFGFFGIFGSANSFVMADSSVANTPTLRVTVSNNIVNSTFQEGIYLEARASGMLLAKVQNNIVGAPVDTGVSHAGIRIDSGVNLGSSIDTNVCAQVSGNTATASAGSVFDGIAFRKEGNIATTNDFGIVGLPSPPATDAAMTTYVRSQNAGSSTGVRANVNDHTTNAVWTSCTLPF